MGGSAVFTRRQCKFRADRWVRSQHSLVSYTPHTWQGHVDALNDLNALLQNHAVVHDRVPVLPGLHPEGEEKRKCRGQRGLDQDFWQSPRTHRKSKSIAEGKLWKLA